MNVLIRSGSLGLLMGAVIVITALVDPVAFSTCLYFYAVVTLLKKDRLLNVGIYFSMAFALAIWQLPDWQAILLFIISLSSSLVRYVYLVKANI